MITIQRLALASLHPAKKNVRKHTDKQIAEYIRSIDMFDQVKPLIVDGNGEIICGNGLYAALVAMGKTECDCYVRDDLTAAQKKKLMLADNRVYELGVTSIDAFEDIIRELGDDIDVPGWDMDLLSTLTATVPDVDNMVSSYGVFASDDTERIKRTEQKMADTSPYGPPRYPSNPDPNAAASSHAPLQQLSLAVNTPSPMSDSLAQNAQETPIPAQEMRYIICPKCGERICL